MAGSWAPRLCWYDFAENENDAAAGDLISKAMDGNERMRPRRRLDGDKDLKMSGIVISWGALSSKRVQRKTAQKLIELQKEVC